MSFSALHSALPDPERDAQFYQGVAIRRIAAFLLDSVLIFLGTAILAFLISVLTLGLATPLAVLFALVSGALYRWATLAHYSATPGMSVMGLELRRHDGARVDATTALFHTLGFHLGLMFFPLFLLASAALMLMGSVRLPHDIPLGTAVINRPV